MIGKNTNPERVMNPNVQSVCESTMFSIATSISISVYLNLNEIF